MNLNFFPIILLFMVLTLPCYSQHYEKEFVNLIHQELGGEKEKTVYGGRVDIVTDEYAIEVEFASKWKHSIGQALWYGLQTNKAPGIVLIKKSKTENKYVIQLGSALQYAGLTDKIKVWVWPDDFKSSQGINPKKNNVPNK